MTYYERLLDWLLAERAEQWHRLQQHHRLAHAADVALVQKETGRIMESARRQLIAELDQEIQRARDAIAGLPPP